MIARRRGKRRGQPMTLTYKGHGSVFRDGAGSGATTMNYGTVASGSAPAAGDLVVWVWYFGAEFYDTSPLTDWRRADLTGAGWAQNNQPAIIPAADATVLYVGSVLAKVVSAGDVSSPPTILPANTVSAGNFGMWIAYSVTGAIASLTIPAATRNSSGASAPGSIGVDSTALTPPAVALTFAVSSGTDGSMQINGITLDREASQANLGGYYTSTADVRAGVKLDVGGAAYTISKGDDGDVNFLFAGYVAVA